MLNCVVCAHDLLTFDYVRLSFFSIHILLVHLVGMTCGVELVYIQSIFLTSNFPQANYLDCGNLSER